MFCFMTASSVYLCLDYPDFACQNSIAVDLTVLYGKAKAAATLATWKENSENCAAQCLSDS